VRLSLSIVPGGTGSFHDIDGTINMILFSMENHDDNNSPNSFTPLFIEWKAKDNAFLSSVK
jgi:hypothetical protein